ncbi:putative membrane protein [Tamilnaduibacter salinus]|uniref:Putative membrane protein n=1 Tax=Tamilnaduibacter salinus TaxID=1484056 RepID=A0A2U1CT43_9GAMM|nr:DUF368 domain-containing protein [Tamilnaduibacter salinus]PVY69627.1 putative membrane protein [Tamilnaduibacter salinus]
MSEPAGAPQRLLGVALRGMAMGAADVVPGVSGGTIAFITGIYQRLLDALGNAPTRLWRAIRQRQVSGLWQSLDGAFLATLLSGILFSVMTLAGVIQHALETWPIPVWSFFFGLILASAWHIGRDVGRWRGDRVALLLAGAALAWWVTGLTPGQAPVNTMTLFGAGALAISAMILPGISGSFVLLLLGMYTPVLSAIDGLAVSDLAVFALGCGAGLLAFARVLSSLMHRFPDRMLALLTGVMLGALNAVWPWKQTISWRLDRDGERVPLVQENLMPGDFGAVTGEPVFLKTALMAVLIGVILVFAVDGYRAFRQCKKRALS